jgi:hypothetical protein
MNRRTSLVLIAAMFLAVAQLSFAQAAKAASSKTLPYAIQVDRVDSKVDGLPAEFSAAIYENLIDSLSKSGKFLQVLRSGDKRASGMPNVLVLKTTVEKFQQGSETTRAVTTVGGATHVFVHMQAAGSDGKALAEKDVEGTVRFFGANLRATQNLAGTMAKQLEQALAAQNTAKK